MSVSPWVLIVLVPHALLQLAAWRALRTIEQFHAESLRRLPSGRVDWATGGMLASVILAVSGKAVGIPDALASTLRWFLASYLVSVLAILAYVWK